MGESDKGRVRKGGGGKCGRSLVVGSEMNGVSLQMEQGLNGSEGNFLWLCGAVMRYLGHGVTWLHSSSNPDTVPPREGN